MPHDFDSGTVAAVLAHMNGDHTDDTVLIARAFGRRGAFRAEMTGFDGDGGDWTVTDSAGESWTLRVSWPGGPISERAEVRREIVALYQAACAELGIGPRPHSD